MGAVYEMLGTEAGTTGKAQVNRWLMMGLIQPQKKIILDDLIKISNLVSLINVGLEWTENFEFNDVCLQELFAKMDQNSDGYNHIIDLIKMIALKRSSIHVVA